MSHCFLFSLSINKLSKSYPILDIDLNFWTSDGHFIFANGTKNALNTLNSLSEREKLLAATVLL